MRRAVGTWAAAGFFALLLAACGGGGGGGSSSTPVSNTVALSVSAGPTGKFVNVVTTSVTICMPGTSNCQTIPDVQVDTGSSGLRLLASKVTLPLPKVASASGSYQECADFADGTLWGGVALADLQLAGETAASLPVQIIGDTPNGPTVPATCSNKGAPENSQAALGVNGILGVGFFLRDCGSYCGTTPDAIYYDCTAAGACIEATIAIGSQVAQPVSLFAQDNNGLVMQLATIPDTGAVAGSGTLTFGIGTQSNNALAGTVLTVPASGANAGAFSASYKGATLSLGFIDSGSSASFFDDPSLPTCSSAGVAPGFYCPGSASALSSGPFTATLTGANGVQSTITGTVANAEFLFNQSPVMNVFDDVAGPAGNTLSGAFDLGVPFLFGRRVYTAIEQSRTSGGTGPYVAF